MRVMMKINLGSKDAAQLKLDPLKCGEGMAVDLADTAAETLIKRGWAVPEIVEAIPKPTMKGK